MKKFNLILFIFVAALSGVYSGFWYISAQRLKDKVIEFFDDEKNNAYHGGIACKGFPFNVEVVVKNPSFQEASGKMATDGNWTIGTSIFCTKGWIEMSGRTMVDPGAEVFLIKWNFAF